MFYIFSSYAPLFPFPPKIAIVARMTNQTPDFRTPVIILVNPQMPENIGMSARAMLNCGLNHLRLVSPRDGWPHDKADAASAGALAQMPNVTVYHTTAEAIADLHYVYATSGRMRHMVKPTLTGPAATTDMQERIARDQRVGILFGPERSGLVNDDLAAANAIMNFPTNPDFASLNVSQAVLLASYEWLRAHDQTPDRRYETVQSPPATADETAHLMTRLAHELDANGFFAAPDLKPSVMRNIGNMFRRADMSSQDVQTFQGIISVLLGSKRK